MGKTKTVYNFGKIRFTRNPMRSAWRAAFFLNCEEIGTVRSSSITGEIILEITRKVHRERFQRDVTKAFHPDELASYPELEQTFLRQRLNRCCAEAMLWPIAKEQLFFKLKGDKRVNFRAYQGMPLAPDTIDRIRREYKGSLVRILRAEELAPPSRQAA